MKLAMKQSLIPLVVVALLRPSLVRGDVIAITPSPSALTISASSGSGIVTASTTLTWTMSGGDHNKDWYITVQASQDPMANCPTVPDSAITVVCNSGSVTGSGSLSCAGGFPLSSSTATQIAGGKEGPGTQNYSLTLTYQFTESWSYKVASCSVILTYLVYQPA